MKRKEMEKLRNNPSALDNKLASLRSELAHIRAQLASGGSIEDPSKVKHLKKDIARVLTMKREMELNG